MDGSGIPKGYHSVTPYLIIDGAEAAIDFYAEAFGAEEVFRMPMGDKIAHAEVKIGDSHVMLSDEWPDMNLLGPKNRGGATASLMIYLPDVDAAFDRAIRAGASVERPVEDQFWGDRMGTVVDPFGHRWTLSTQVREVSPDEMQAKMKEWEVEVAAQ
ncbi:VOC family protein [Allosphingosinicella flava]|uniref:VOC family protein n=1 Tax=Allosphingosinicella flava TaxID=2771430 RepID=A0A7T2LL56_9SPHN|nr:VOC family protein [Sphingosinicella flava]QPQ54069.1 VOC family protein [Sphingosinicella flava]